MGEVWAATDAVLDREVAVKLLRDDIGDDPAALQRFRTEARHAGALTHPGVARVYDYGEEELEPPVAYLVMELVDGRPVAARSGGAPLPAGVVADVLAQAAEALGAAHARGIVHRDVKPGNLLLTADGNVKVTDFGIAHAIGATVTDDGKVAGTAQYMSPEQAMGDAVGPTSDVYSLAVVGYQLLTGHTPFEGPPGAVALAHVQALPPPLPANVPADLRELLDRCLSKRPQARPADGTVLADELRGLRSSLQPGGSAVPASGVAAVVDERAPTVPDATRVWTSSLGPVASVGQAVTSHRRRGWAMAAIAVLFGTAVVVLGAEAAADATVSGEIPGTTTVAALAEPATTAATPTTVVVETTAPPPPATDAPGPAKGNQGNGNNGKGKGKDKG